MAKALLLLSALMDGGSQRWAPPITGPCGIANGPSSPPLSCVWRFTPPASPVPLLPEPVLRLGDGKKRATLLQVFPVKIKAEAGAACRPSMVVTDVLFQQMQIMLGSSQARTRRKLKGGAGKKGRRAMAAGGLRGAFSSLLPQDREPSLASGQQGKWPGWPLGTHRALGRGLYGRQLCPLSLLPKQKSCKPIKSRRGRGGRGRQAFMRESELGNGHLLVPLIHFGAHPEGMLPFLWEGPRPFGSVV